MADRENLDREQQGELDTKIREDTDVHDATGGEGGRLTGREKVTPENDLFHEQKQDPNSGT